MEGYILGPAALDYRSSIRSTASSVVGQHSGNRVRIEGSVTIELGHHEPKCILRPQLLVDPKGYTWFDEGDRRVLRHSFNDPMKPRHAWRDGHALMPWTVDFDIDMIRASTIQCYDTCRSSHSKDTLSYVFTTFADYQLFQTKFRGKIFRRDFDVKTLYCHRSDTHEQRNQCIKSWESDGKLSLTIPVSVRPPGTKSAWKIEHVEIMAVWMEWHKVKSQSVKATYKKARRKSSLPQWLLPRGSSHATTSNSDTEEAATANPIFMERWPSFVIGLSSVKARDDLLQEVTGAFVPSTLPSPLSDLTKGTSVSHASSNPKSLIDGTPPNTPPTELSSPQLVGDLKTSIELTDSGSDGPEPTKTGKSPQILLRDEYLRVGGPHSAPRVISASQSQVYEKLANTGNGIRILRIAGGKRKEPLSCSLIYESLETAPRYEALSYCWGVEEATHAIPQGNLKGFKVTEHLFRALSRLRMDTEDRLVWIDALCIDQQNVDERNHQLALMRQIYAKALRTIIWIGDFRPDEKSCKRAFLDEGDTGLTLCVTPGLAETEHGNAVEDLRNDLQGLQMQKASTIKSDVWWRRLCLFDKDDNPLEMFKQLRNNIPRTLAELLSLTGAFNASDPRDRIFALLGMAHVAGAAIPPNYHHSVIRVIEDAVMYLIEESSTLDILLDERPTRHVWGKEQLPGIMPSWMPDLTCLLKTGFMFDPKTSNEKLESLKFNAGLPRDEPSKQPFLTLSPAANYKAANSNTIYDLPRILHCRAWYFDAIEKRTVAAGLPSHEQSPNGYLIYNSRQIRGKIVDWILNSLEYDFNTVHRSRKRTKQGLDDNPRIGLLLLYYLLEDRRSHVLELENRLQAPKKNLVKFYQQQRKSDIQYVVEEVGEQREHADADIAYMERRWELKISREENNQRFIPERLKAALETNLDIFQQDFEVARELGNLYAYVRGTRQRYYLCESNPDAPMRKDVLNCSSMAEVMQLKTQFEAGDTDIEFHEYNAKTRERDFFKTNDGFLGLGPACMEVGDKIVVPLSASRPFVLREHPPHSGYHILIGEAVVPSIMGGGWARLENDSYQEFKIK